MVASQVALQRLPVATLAVVQERAKKISTLAVPVTLIPQVLLFKTLSLFWVWSHWCIFLLKSAEKVPWSAEVEQGIKISAGKDIDDIRSEVIGGLSTVWKVTGEGVAGFVVLRVDGSELVIVCGEGQGAKFVIPWIMETARQHNLTVRTHVKRRGLVRMWQRYGLCLDEYVLRG